MPAGIGRPRESRRWVCLQPILLAPGQDVVEAVSTCPGGQFDTVSDPHFRSQAIDVVFDRVGAQMKLERDLVIG